MNEIPVHTIHKSPLSGETNRAFSIRFAKNSIFYFTSQIAGKGLFFLITVYLARVLGASEYGKFAFAYGFVTLFSVITKFGLDLITSRDVGENPKLVSKYLGATLSLRTLLSILFLLVMILAIPILQKNPDVDRLILLIAGMAVFHSIAGVGTSLLDALQLFSYRSVLNVMMYGFSFSILVLGRATDLYSAGIAMISGAALYCAFSLLLSHRKVGRIRLSLDGSFLWQLFKSALPLGLMEIFVGIYYRIDTVLLSLLTTDAVVGWYDAAYTFVYGLRLLPVSVAMVLLPALSRMHSLDVKNAIAIYRKSVYFSIATGVWVTFLIAVNAEVLVSLIFGASYDPSSEVLQLLIWTCVIMFANAFQGILLVVTQQRVTFLRATLIGASSNLILNLLLIPRIGMFGAAVATILSEFLVFIACTLSLQRYISFSMFLRYAVAPAFGCLVMYSLWRYAASLHFVLLSLICSAAYLIVVLSLKGASLNKVDRDG